MKGASSVLFSHAEVTIPEHKLSKGKGPKTSSKEKRSILLESEVGEALQDSGYSASHVSTALPCRFS